jgi:hypothetical protein
MNRSPLLPFEMTNHDIILSCNYKPSLSSECMRRRRNHKTDNKRQSTNSDAVSEATFSLNLVFRSQGSPISSLLSANCLLRKDTFLFIVVSVV